MFVSPHIVPGLSVSISGGMFFDGKPRQGVVMLRCEGICDRGHVLVRIPGHQGWERWHVSHLTAI